MDLLYEFLSVIDANGLLVLLICLAIGSFIILVISSSQKAEIEALKKGLIKAAEMIDDKFKLMTEIDEKIVKAFESVDQTERGMSETIRQHDNALRDIRIHLAIEPSENDDLEQSIQETIEAKERFHKLSEELSVEEFKEKAEKYLEEMIQETYDAVDNSWGDDLVITCEKQNRFKEKLEKVKEASTSKEAFEAMFSLC